MKELDNRYGTIKILIEAGHIKSIRGIFQFIPKTTVYRDLGVNFNRFDRAILNPAIFRMQELVKLAELFEVDTKKFIDIAYEQAVTYRKMQAKRPRYSRPAIKLEKSVDSIIQNT